MIEKNKIKLFLLILILLRAIIGFSQNTNNLLDSTLNLNEQQKQILILNSWGRGLPIPDETKQGIHIALEAGGVSMNDVFFEDLDLVRSSGSEHRLNLVSLLRHKLVHKQIGIVILIGSPAIEFLAIEGKELFPDAALIALITPNVNSLNNDPRKIMYLPWRVDPEGSVKLALELFPNTKHVFVITGANDGVLPFLDEAKKAFIPWENKLDFEFTNEMTYEEMIQRASSLTNESIILYSTFFTDKLNRSFIPAEVVVEVCEKSKVPVFATLEYYMGLGIVGGALLETESVGKHAGNIAIDYLSGKIVLKEHVTSFDTPIHSMIDWQSLKRFQINYSGIPKDWIIVGKPLTLWEQYKLLVIAVVSVFLILSALIITLVLWNRRIHKMRIAALESERQLKLIADDIVNGMIYQVAMLDEDHRKFNYISENVNKLYGCTVEEAKENANLIYGKLHPDDINGLVEKEKEALKKMSVFETEARVVTPNGTIRWAYYISQPRIINGIVCWDGIEVDITERKQMEFDLVKAKEKAEESDHLKSAFLANMSHEIRTPMNGILGFAGLLKESDLTGDQQQEYIRIIEKSGNRMLNIINDIVDISRIEAGHMKLEMKESNINEQIEYIYTFFKPEMEAKGIKFSLKNTLPAKEAIIKTDREKLYAILTNLIKNAIKYTDKGSIEFGYFKKDDYLEFYVKDTGIGIPNDRQEAIFERFIQADIVDEMARQGAGLGLTISRAYVEMLRGKIWVESKEGKGSTFYFTIPYNVESKQKTLIENDVQAATEIHLKNLKVLIVEDDETSTMLISIMVKPFSKEILKVNTGSEAVDTCLNNPDIDLILMDIQLPKMNGYEATKQIRKFNNEVVIIAQTAFGLTGDKEKAIMAGCNDYISKPIIKEELKKIIRRYFKI